MTERPLAVRRFAAVAVVLPAALTLAAVIVQLVVLPSVPDPIAVHWGGPGAPDGFGPAWLSPVLTVAVGFGLPLLLAATSLPGLRRGGRGATYRLLGAVAAGLSALAAVLFTWTLVMQAGLADAADAPAIWAPLIASYVAAIGVGALAWAVQPKAPRAPEPAETSTPSPLALGDGVKAVWLRTVTLPRGATAAIAAACLLVAGLAVGAWLTAAPTGSALIVSLCAVVLVVLAATTTAFHVRVDDSGLRVVSALGIPRFHVPLGDIESVSVVDVNPMGEFGGWGIRLAPGRFGVVLRRGEAIEVERRGRRYFVVTVDDAERGAALLLALRDRMPAS